MMLSSNPTNAKGKTNMTEQELLERSREFLGDFEPGSERELLLELEGPGATAWRRIAGEKRALTDAERVELLKFLAIPL